MMIDSDVLHQKLNKSDLIDWMDKDKSSLNYKQGYLSGLLKAITVIDEVEYFTEHGYYRTPIENHDMDVDIVDGLKKVVGAISDKINETNLSCHSERDIVLGCISLMSELYNDMLEYMDYMGFKYDNNDEEEKPIFKYSYFEIVQELLLRNTTHSGGTSTRAKCEKLGFDSFNQVIFEEDLDEN